MSKEELPEPNIMDETGEGLPIEEVIDDPMLTRFGESQKTLMSLYPSEE